MNNTFLHVAYGDAAFPVTFMADYCELCRSTPPGLYDIRLVFSNIIAPIRTRLLAALNDFTCSVAKSAYLTVHDHDRDKFRKYLLIGVPDITVNDSEIIIKAACTETLNNYILPGSYIPNIIEVIFNNPATIVYWSDGTKTVVKACDKDTFDKETGLAMAIAKKTLSYKCLQPRARFKHIVKSAKDYSDKQ